MTSQRDRPQARFTWGDAFLLGVAVLVLLRGLAVADDASDAQISHMWIVFAVSWVIGAALAIGGLLYHVKHPLPAEETARRRARNIRIILVVAPFLGVLGGAMGRWGIIGLQVIFYGWGSGFMLAVMLGYVFIVKSSK